MEGHDQTNAKDECEGNLPDLTKNIANCKTVHPEFINGLDSKVTIASTDEDGRSDVLSPNGSYDIITDSENEIEARRISQNYLFGFKKWKSHVTSRPLSDRSDVVKTLYSDIDEVDETTVSTLGVSNIIYVILFGWWQALLYIIVAGIMFLTVVGSDYAHFCVRMADYFFWPFGKFIYLVNENCIIYTTKYYHSKTSVSTNLETAAKEEETSLLRGQKYISSRRGFFSRYQSYIWMILGLPVLIVSHAVVMVIAWLGVISIPIAKINWRTVKEILFYPPSDVKIEVGTTTMETTINKKRSKIVMFIHKAINLYYYKYTVDGVNIIIANMMAFVVATVCIGIIDTNDVVYSALWKCILGVVGIAPLTYYIGMAIISISAQSNYAVGAVLNATFGSAVEIIIYVMVLEKGASLGSSCYNELVKSALAGSIIGCVLFIPGMCMVVGGIKYRSQLFNPKSANITALLLFVAIGGVFAPTIFSKIFGDFVCTKCQDFCDMQNVTTRESCNASNYKLHCMDCVSKLSGLDGDHALYETHILPLVYACALLMPIAYFIGMFFALKTHSSHIQEDFNAMLKQQGQLCQSQGNPQWSRIKSVVILLICATLIALCAHVITDNLEEFFKETGISEIFIGVTVIAMVSELPEIVNGILFALQNNVNLGMEIGTSVAVQVCMIQVPILILINLVHPYHLHMVFNDIHLYAVIFGVVVINYTFQDGKSDYFQGAALVFIYVVLLCMYYFMPTPEEAKCE